MAWLGFDAASGASSDNARRRGLPTARGDEGDTTIFTYDVVLSGMEHLLPSPPPLGTYLVPAMLGSCSLGVLNART
jgi:hypothetical protein